MIIVDTNVIIDIERGKKSLEAVIELFPDEKLFISEISIFELYVGLGYSKKKKESKFYQTQKEYIEKILTDFELIPINLNILKKAALKQGELMAEGVLVDFEDIIIGTVAENFQAKCIITRNKKHFQNFSVLIQDYKI